MLRRIAARIDDCIAELEVTYIGGKETLHTRGEAPQRGRWRTLANPNPRWLGKGP
jgi:hypothetical protein